MGGETIRRRSREHRAGPGSIRIHGGGAGANWLRAGGETERDHPSDPVSPKAREMKELRARIAELLKNNDGLQAQVAEWNRRLEEAKGRRAAAEEERIRAEAESTK